MSPEQALGKKVDHRTDIWSFGCLLYEMLAGRGPFQGGHEQAVFHEIIHADPSPVTSLRHDIPAGMVDLIARILSLHTLLFVPSIIDNIYRLTRGGRESHRP